MQNYATQQQYPLMQLGVMSNMLRGLPMQASTTQNYQAAPSLPSQIAGTVGTGLGLAQMYNQAFPGRKEGGVIKMAGGGIATGANPYKLAGMYEKFSDEQLAKEKDDPVAQREMQHRAALRASMARGGIVAFKEGKTVKGPKVSDVYPEEFERGSAKGIAQNPVPDDAPAQDDAPKVDPYASHVGPYLSNELGITAAKAKPTYEETLAGQTAKLEQRQKDLEKTSKMTVAEKIAEQTKAREAANLPAPYGSEMEKIEARRTAAKEDVKDQAKDRLIMFLQRWGTLPGGTLLAMNQAGREMIEQSSFDKKDQRKLLDHLDTVESNLKQAEYMRRIGDEKEAQAAIEKAGVEYDKVGEKIVDNTVKLINNEATNAAREKIAQLQREVAEAKANGKELSDYKTRLQLIANDLKQDPKFKGLSDTSIIAAADKKIREYEITKASAGAAQSVPVKNREADIHERSEKVKTNKEVNALVDEAVDRDPGKRAAKKADKASGTTTEMDKLRNKHESKIRADLGEPSPATPVAAPKQAAPKKDKSGLAAFDK
jgi:hypothetical protein